MHPILGFQMYLYAYNCIVEFEIQKDEIFSMGGNQATTEDQA